MLGLTKDQIRGLIFLAVIPWFLLVAGLWLNWDYFSVLWTDVDARTICLYLLGDYVVALGFCFGGCVGVNRLYPSGEERWRRKRGILNFTVFILIVLAMVPVWFGIIGLPAYIQLQKSAVFGQPQ
jgi:hypothetical protein